VKRLRTRCRWPVIALSDEVGVSRFCTFLQFQGRRTVVAMTAIPPSLPGAPVSHVAQPPVARSTNGWAIASLIVGIFGCLPIVPGLFAMIFGILGIRKSKVLGRKGMAYAGLILGTFSFFGWGAIGVQMSSVYEESIAPRAAVKQFVYDLSSNNSAAAVQRAAGALSRERIDETIDLLQGYGLLRGTTMLAAEEDGFTDCTHWDVFGVARFSPKWLTYKAKVVKEGEVFKITEFEFLEFKGSGAAPSAGN
jgi:hypothetical protein